MTHATHRMHENSIAANKTLDKRTRADEVKGVIAGAMTDREIRDALGYREMNQVRPTITGLIDIGELIEAGRMTCDTTGRPVRLTRLCKGTPTPRRSSTQAEGVADRIPAGGLEAYVHTALEHCLETGITITTVSLASGIHRVNLSRFRSKKSDLTLVAADKLMRGLEILKIPAPLCAACG